MLLAVIILYIASVILTTVMLKDLQIRVAKLELPEFLTDDEDNLIIAKYLKEAKKKKNGKKA